MMTRLVQVTIALISACESKFALAAYEEIISTSEGSNGKEADGGKSDSDSRCDEKTEKHKRNIDLIKPTREIESSDIDLFEDILSPIRLPAREMQDHIQDAVNTIMSALIYCYDVPKPKSEPASKPDSILKEMDKGTDKLTKALAKFDAESAATLESAAASTYGEDLMRNVTPRMETHLISTFLINISQAGSQVLDMLKHARTLIERKHSRNSRRRLYWPRISWKKWLTSGGESDGNALPENARKEARAGFGMTEDSKNTDDEATSTSTETLLNPKHDIETGEVCGGRPAEFQRGRIPRRKGPKKAKASTGLWTRGIAADVVEFLMDSSDLTFALKMTVAALLVTWPAFIPSLNPWYVSVRGTWATLQLILVFEVSIGTSFRGFFLRAFGTIFGCSIGIVAFEVGQGNLVVLVVVLVIGLIPSSFIHLTTSYVKAGVISMISLAVVGISTVVPVNQDSPEETYVKRLICFLVGGVVALLVEMIFFPVRARDRLVECLASSIKQISIMEASVAVGVDSTDKVDLKSHALNASFKSAKDKAEQALIAAKTFLPFCLTEPRIKGSFRGQALVYGEMIYVLFQIIERIDNMLHIRKLYGSTILEELHAEILPYRRNVAGCVSLTLFAVGEALTTRLPLPQFLPSSRVAQLRNVARVREILLERSRESAQADVAIESGSNGSPRVTSHEINDPTVQSLTQRNFLAWNASSINMMEIIEYLEELVDLAKLLVGVNAFRSGMLERPKFQQYIHKIRARETEAAAAKSNILESKKPRGRKGNRQPPGDQPADATSTGLRRRQTTHVGPQATGGAPHYGDDFFDSSDLPLSLQRVISKRMDRGDRLSRLKRTDIGSGNPHTLRSAKTWMG
ncbi:hypothetical protein GGR57DRAFT_123625 [Xylariaceae sp. FL1272]|nr:hypothetical protein GGR57DRAFT_123625 [Xylariaceae sp. FL1272]